MNRLALALGIAFGFGLGAARLNDYDVIHNMLLLREPDVFLLMASAMAVALPALWLLERTAWRTPNGEIMRLSRSKIARKHLFGSAVFGTGWAITGACPGTALAMPTAGVVLGLPVIAGVVAGQVLREMVAARPHTALVKSPRYERKGRNQVQMAVPFRSIVVLLLALCVSFSVPGPVVEASSRTPLNQVLVWPGATSFTVFNANSPIAIDIGKIGFVSSCLEGTKDFIFPFADVYIVPAGSVTLGTVLTDSGGGLPNAVSAASDGSFVDEVIGITKPGGTIAAGTYAVVYDECQDGTFDALDALFDPAFKVVIPTDAPTVDFSAYKHSVVGQQQQWTELVHQVEVLKVLVDHKSELECLYSAVQGAAIIGCVSEIVIEYASDKVKDRLSGSLKPIDPVEGALAFAKNVIKHYQGIAADPPDPNFGQPSLVSGLARFDAGTRDPLLRAMVAAGNESGVEDALAAALLRSLERYQGAAAARDGDAAILHAREIGMYTRLLADQLTSTDAALADLSAALTGGSFDFDSAGTAWSKFHDQVASAGLGTDVSRRLRNLGLSQADVDSLRTELLGVIVPNGARTDLQSAVSALRTANVNAAEELRTFGMAMDAVIAELAADAGVSGLEPLASAGGPYVGIEGSSIAMAGSASVGRGGRAIVSYEWDLDGDAAFDDAVGSSPSFVPAHDFHGLVGLRVTDDANSVGFAYAHISISDVNGGPSITSVTPSETRPSVLIGTARTFSINASDPEGDAVSVEWSLDAAAPISGATFTYSPADPSGIGLHILAAKTFNDQGSAGFEWHVAALAADRDGDGWNSNIDCDDADAAVHPEAIEIVGNGKDDDCDPATPDAGSAPIAFFAPAGAARNVALLEGGATVVAFSSEFNSLFSAASLIDYEPDFPYWGTGNGKTTDQWITLRLADGKIYLIDRVLLRPLDSQPTERVRDFEIAVSTTTTDDAAFATVLRGTAADSGALQEFVFGRPVPAMYVRYRPLNNRGSACCISTQQLKVMTGQEGAATVTFGNLSSDPDGDISSYLWDFGDGSASDTTTSPTHTFPPGPGTYTVTLKVADGGGQSSTSSLAQRVLVSPTGGVESNASDPNEGQSVMFSATVSDPDGGSIIRYRWHWGDGSPDSSSNPAAHAFSDNGHYLVALDVIDSQEQAAHFERVVSPINLPPTVDVGPERSISIGINLSFAVEVTDAGALDTLQCRWDFGDSTSSPLGPCGAFAHTFERTGTYEATLTVIDDDAGSATDSLRISVFTYSVLAGFAATDFVTGFVYDQCCGNIGPIGLGFDLSGNLVVLNAGDGFLYIFGPHGGSASAPTRLSTAPLPGKPLGLAFDRAGRLYVARQSASDVVEIDHASGSILRVVAAIPCATGIAADPLSGDLFVTTAGCASDLRRISNFADGPGTVTIFARTDFSPDGITFGPDGTIYVATNSGTVSKFTGTNASTPGSATLIAAIPTADGIAVSEEVGALGPTFLFANRNDGIISRVDLTTTPPIVASILTRGTRGDFIAVGPDGCLYATQSQSILKITSADGSCAFAPTGVVPRIALAPPSQTGLVGMSRTVTASLHNVASPAGASVTFTVTGANPQTATRIADSSGLATFSYAGGVLGMDTVVARTTIGTSTVTSSGATVTWTMGLHFSVAAPPSVTAGSPFSFSVAARDAAENTVADYFGTVRFASSDPLAALPANYIFTPADVGVHTFTATLNTAGSQSLTTADTAISAITGTASVLVSTSPAAHLTVIKHVINNNGGTAAASDWTMAVNGAAVSPISLPGSEAGTTFLMNAGSYSVTESGGPAGYVPALSGDCAGSIAASESRTCTITNDDMTAHLKLVKAVINDDGGMVVATDFNLAAAGPTPINGNGGVESDVNAGTYTLSETGPAGYSTTGYDCGALVTLALGESKTCAITNDDIQPRLIVIKHVINDNGGAKTASAFVMNVTGSSPSPASFPGAELPGTAVILGAGNYSVSESSVFGYTQTSAVSCAGTVAAGETKTCIITDDDQPGTIIVQKVAKPANTGSFRFTTTGMGYNTFTLSGGSQNNQTLNAGTYMVNEGTQLGWILTGIGGSTDPNTPYSCTVIGSGGSTGVGDLNSQTATINLENGDSVICVFENTGQGVTRTQGFWATHKPLANIGWFGGTAFGHNFPGAAGVAGISDTKLCGRNIDTLGKLMSGFWSDISKTSTGAKRSALDQARMQLLQQMLAAELNASAFGTVPSGGSGQFAAWEAAYCGTNQNAIKNALQQAASFNTAGDSAQFTPGTSADSKNARAIANKSFWDILP